MFWALGYSEKLTVLTTLDLIFTPKATWKFQNGVLLLMYVFLQFSFIFAILMTNFIKYLLLVDKEALMSLFRTTPSTSKCTKQNTWSSCYHWAIKRIAESELINNMQSPVCTFAIAV